MMIPIMAPAPSGRTGFTTLFSIICFTAFTVWRTKNSVSHWSTPAHSQPSERVGTSNLTAGLLTTALAISGAISPFAWSAITVSQGLTMMPAPLICESIFSLSSAVLASIVPSPKSKENRVSQRFSRVSSAITLWLYSCSPNSTTTTEDSMNSTLTSCKDLCRSCLNTDQW